MKLALRSASYASNGVKILDPISLEFPAGTKVVLLGPNGAGKTTLLRLLSGYFEPTTGEVELDGKTMSHFPLAERSRTVAVLTQHNALDFPFSAREVVSMGRIPYGRAAIDDRIVEEVLDLLEIDGESVYTNLSGGERQLVHIARVLVQVWGREADGCLLLDEPTAALDLKHQQKVISVLENMSEKGISQVIVIHDVNLAAELADEVVLLMDGNVVASGVREEVLNVENLQTAFGVPMHALTDPDSGRTYFVNGD